MTAMADIIEELKRLPGEDLEAAASYIHTLAEGRRRRRLAVTESTAGSLKGPSGEAFEAALAISTNWPRK